MDIISRVDAKALGLTRYFTGVPCKAGHTAERIVSKYRCVVCERARDAKRVRIRNRDNTARWRAYNAKHPGRKNAATAAWRLAHPEFSSAANRRRRARRLGAPGSGISHTETRALKRYANGICAYCEVEVGIDALTIDHVVPLYSGGSDSVSNATACCFSCNTSKRHFDVSTWYERKFGKPYVRKASLPCP